MNDWDLAQAARTEHIRVLEERALAIREANAQRLLNWEIENQHLIDNQIKTTNTQRRKTATLLDTLCTERYGAFYHQIRHTT